MRAMCGFELHFLKDRAAEGANCLGKRGSLGGLAQQLPAIEREPGATRVVGQPVPQLASEHLFGFTVVPGPENRLSLMADDDFDRWFKPFLREEVDQLVGLADRGNRSGGAGVYTCRCGDSLSSLRWGWAAG